MKSIKIIKQFFTQKDALKAARYQKDLAKKAGQKVSIEIIEAHKVHSTVKKSIGSPRPNDFIIIIKRQQPNTIKKVVQKVIKKTKMIISKVFRPIRRQSKPSIQVATLHTIKFVSLKPAASLNTLPIIVPFSLYSRYTA